MMVQSDPERPHAKKKELDELYEKSEEIGDPSFWDSDEVKAFIEEGDNDIVKCDNCGCWSDEIFQNGSSLFNVTGAWYKEYIWP